MRRKVNSFGVIRIPEREATSTNKVFRMYPFTNVENKLPTNGPNNLYHLFHIHQSQLSTLQLLARECWELMNSACWQWCAGGCNNSRRLWDLHCIMERIRPIKLCKITKLDSVMHIHGPSNSRAMLEELCKRIQHCCATLRRSRNKNKMFFGSCWLKINLFDLF